MSDSKAESQSRRRKHQIVPACMVTVINEADQVLLHRRQNTNFMDCFLDLPSGHVEPGETYLSAAQRELREETGLTCRKDQLSLYAILICSQPDVTYQFNFYHLTELGQQKPEIMEPEKCSYIGYFDPAELGSEKVSPISQWGISALDLFRSSGKVVEAAADLDPAVNDLSFV